MESTVPRGIPNVSGVACHLSSALQLLLHSVPALRRALLELRSSQRQETEWLQELCRLTHVLFSEKDVPIDPMSLYIALSETTSLNPHSLGDAASALRILLRTLQQCQYLEPVLNHCLLRARVGQTLTGTRISESGQRIQRRKTTKKAAPCPLSVPVREETCLRQALEKATIQPQPIYGLNWKQVSNYTEEEIGNDNGEECSNLTTQQTTRFISLPQHLVLHLQRFRYEHDTVNVSTNSVDIPKELDLLSFMLNKNGDDDRLYEFAGAILYVSDPNESSSDEDEGGHYVTLVQSYNNAGGIWYLLDDEKVTPLPDEDEVLAFVSGRTNDVDGLKNEGTYSTTVVIYSRIYKQDTDKVTIQLLEDLKAKILEQQAIVDMSATDAEVTTTTIDWSQPLNLIGKRLQVRWKSGRYYSGVVTSFDDESGKHCVMYDDGDVRHYTLRKRTIKWLD